MIFNTIKNQDQQLRTERAQLLVALRDLVYADAMLMEDFGNKNCDYCSGGDDDVPDGHDLTCNFAAAFDILLHERATGEEEIKAEITDIRDALVMLISEDMELSGSTGPCPYCDSEYSHEDDCVFEEAIQTLIRIPRR